MCLFQVGPSRRQGSHSNWVTGGDVNNKGTVHKDLGGMQGNLKGQFGALGDSGSSYHPRVCVGRTTWQELGPSV